MKAIEIPTTDPEELLDQMAHLVGEVERRQYFDRRPDLVSEEQVRALCVEVARQARADSERAFELATTARFIAARLSVPSCRALAARASANALHCLGDYDRAQERYEEALAAFAELEDSLSAAITRSSALQNLAYLGEYEKAFRWEARAREAFEAIDDRLRLAILDNNYANVLQRQDRWQEAQEHYYAAYEVFVGLERPEDAILCLNNVATCYLDLHLPDQALQSYSQSKAYCVEQDLPHLEMVVDYHLALIYYLRTEYNRAIKLYQTARRSADSFNDRHQHALCELGLCEIYLELNLVEDAERLAKSSFDGFDRLKMPYEAAISLTNNAIAASRLGDVERAMLMLRRARRSFVSEQNQLWPALIDFYRAVVLAQADRLAEAEDYARSALQSMDASGLDSRATMCEVLLATILLRSGSVPAAREVCLAALDRLKDLELPALDFQVFQVLGQVEEELGSTEQALEAYERCDHWLEQMHSRLQGEDLKISFFGAKQTLYESLVFLNFAKGDENGQEEICLRYIEKSKSRSLADLLAFGAHALPAKSAEASELAERARGLREELNWFYRQLDVQSMREGTEAQATMKRLQAAVREKEDALLQAQRELTASDLELGSIQSAAMLDPEVVRASIPDNAQLVEYFIARGRLLVAVIDGHDSRLMDLGSESLAREKHRLLQFQLSRGVHGRSSPGVAALIQQSTMAHLKGLYRLLVAPIEHLLQRDHLIIAPHGFLHYVPFQALTDEAGAALVERFSISYTPSGSVFHLCATKNEDLEDKSLIMGVADDLAPHILDEVRAVADVLPGAHLLEGESASEDALRELGNGCRYLHIATHGLFRRDNPMFSAIQLGTSRLSLFDLYNLRLSTEMVVLSGCGTGLNAVLGADELLGLTRGVLYAGAKSVLVTLWDVHDASTAAFMRRFYRHLVAGVPRAKALQQTMLEHHAEYPQPYFWAPFVLIGDPG